MNFNSIQQLLKSLKQKIAHPAKALDVRCRELETNLINTQREFRQLTQNIETLKIEISTRKLNGQPISSMDDELDAICLEADSLKHSILEMGNELAKLSPRGRP